MKIKPPFPLQANGILSFAQFTVKVFLNLPAGEFYINDPGINGTGVRYEGNVIDSGNAANNRRFPPEITVDTHLFLRLDSGMTGTFVIEQIYSPQWKSLESVIGQKFGGLFLPARQTKPGDWT